MNTEAIVQEVLTCRFPGIIRKYSRALNMGITNEADLLSDYQLGVAIGSKKVKSSKDGVPAADYLHYRGLCEVQRQFRLRRQKSTLNVCQTGHTYAFNKSRKICPKCKTPFTEEQKFHVIPDESIFQAKIKTTIDFDDLKKLVNLLPIPPKQRRIFKVLLGNGLFLEEDHAITDTAKLIGISRVRVAKVVRQNRQIVRGLLIQNGFLAS